MPNVLANPVAGFGLDALSVPDAGDPIGINFTTEEVRLVTNVGDSVPTDFAFGSE